MRKEFPNMPGMHRLSSLFLCCCIPVLVQPLAASPILRSPHVFRPVTATEGMVVGAEEKAAQAALQVLKDGGNVVDAAVTMGLSLAVTLPRAGNIGGGGFMLIHEAGTGTTYALDYREMAPAASTRDMFLDAEGHADPDLSRDTPLAVGVPGTVAGLLAAHERFGSRPLEELIAPAIRLARDGFPVDRALSEMLVTARDSGRLKGDALKVFFKEDGSPYEAGELLVQPELAASLERIARNGTDGFYKGPVAGAITGTIRKNGGIMTMEDLAAYKPVWREPVRGTYKGYEVQSMPPPSSGGVHLVQMLNLLEGFPLQDWGHNSSQTVHIMAEVMKRAYADRSRHLGDTDFVPVPLEGLLSEAYESEIRDAINSMQPTPSTEIQPGEPPAPESPETTHFSIVDREGNAVSNTYTLNFSFGSGYMAEGTGILLNNEMDDFSAKPGVPNAYGLIGGEKNAIEPGKRMLSSMTPTIILRDGEVRIVTGSPGGSRIINTVLQVSLNIMEFGLNAAEATSFPRFHHQWLPDTLQVELGFPTDTITALRLLGYTVETSPTIGAAATIVREDHLLKGANDPRRPGTIAIGY